MKHPVLPVAVALAVLTALPGCGERPQPRPPAAPSAGGSSSSSSSSSSSMTIAPPPTAPAQPAQPAGVLAKVSGPDDDSSRMEVGGIVAPKPPQWTWQQPSMQFRTLQYAVPAPGTSTGSAELIVSVFFEGDGGPLETNISRWVQQFRSADGAAAEPIREERTIDEMRVILLELAGSYQGMGGTGPRPDFMQFGAIIDAPGRRVFIRLLGPASTVEANREEWDALVEGLRDATRLSS